MVHSMFLSHLALAEHVVFGRVVYVLRVWGLAVKRNGPLLMDGPTMKIDGFFWLWKWFNSMIF